MPLCVAHIATSVNSNVALANNDFPLKVRKMLRMSRTPRIHQKKSPPRIHYLAEWAERRNITQADVCRAVGADKATVSRWFAGRVPETPYLLSLSAMFGFDEPNEMFRPPEDDWIRRFFYNRSVAELNRMRATLEAAFPPDQKADKDGTDG